MVGDNGGRMYVITPLPSFWVVPRLGQSPFNTVMADEIACGKCRGFL